MEIFPSKPLSHKFTVSSLVWNPPKAEPSSSCHTSEQKAFPSVFSTKTRGCVTGEGGQPCLLCLSSCSRATCGPSSGHPASLGRVWGLLPVPGTWPSWPRAGNGWHACWTKPKLACSQLVDEFRALPSSPPASPLPRGTGAEANVTTLPSLTHSLHQSEGRHLAHRLTLVQWNELHQGDRKK